MSDIYYYQSRPRFGIDMMQNAVCCAMYAKDTISALNYYGHLTDCYELLGDEDSVLLISELVRSEFEKKRMFDAAAAIASRGILIDLKRDSIGKAKEKIDFYISHSGFIDEFGEISKEHEIFLSHIALYYEKLGNQDSAYYYYNKLSKSSDSNSKEAAYKGLMQLCKLKGDSYNATIYAEKYCNLNDSSVVAHSSEEISRMQALYNYSNLKAQKEKADKKVQRYHIYLLFLLAFVLFSSILVLFSSTLVGSYTK